MDVKLPLITVCIPAYNRAKFLPPLLSSIILQNTNNYEILIAEDNSPERDEIALIAEHYARTSPVPIRIIFNSKNLGYDANIRNLIRNSTGRFCFFMGNDDIMAPSALQTVEKILLEHPNIGVLLKSYAIFSESFQTPNAIIQYFDRDMIFKPGIPAMAVGVRRAGVISGFILDRALAQGVETDKYDGGLYYQVYLAAQALATKSLYYTREILVFSRSTEQPEFGNAESETKDFVVGSYTPNARVKMLSSALAIVNDVCAIHGLQRNAYLIERDYATYLYPFISDQLRLSFRRYFIFYVNMARTGMWRYPLFHVNMILFYALRSSNPDNIVHAMRRLFRS